MALEPEAARSGARVRPGSDRGQRGKTRAQTRVRPGSARRPAATAQKPDPTPKPAAGPQPRVGAPPRRARIARSRVLRRAQAARRGRPQGQESRGRPAQARRGARGTHRRAGDGHQGPSRRRCRRRGSTTTGRPHKPLIDRHQALMWEVGDLMNQWEALADRTVIGGQICNPPKRAARPQPHRNIKESAPRALGRGHTVCPHAHRPQERYAEVWPPRPQGRIGTVGRP